MPLNFVSVDPNFCGFCGAILQTPNFAPSSVTCKVCGCEWHVREKRNEVVCRVEKIYERTVADTKGVELEHGGDAVVEHVCSKSLTDIYIMNCEQQCLGYLKNRPSFQDQLRPTIWFIVEDFVDATYFTPLTEDFTTGCGHNKASYSTMQTRSADEGQTVFYTCLKCKRKDIEYS